MSTRLFRTTGLVLAGIALTTSTGCLRARLRRRARISRALNPPSVVAPLPTPGGVTIVTVRPPAAKVEVKPARPTKGHVWIGGRWRRAGGNWIWVPGRWTARPGGNAFWIAGHWSKARGGWKWVPGHWR